MRYLVFFLLILVALRVEAAVEVLEFDTVEQEQRYRDLIDELRCMVCQNQNLADSNAELAEDLRERTYAMVRRGDSYETIIEHMVARYGDFVLYKPPFKTTTLLLWLGPIVFLMVALITIWSYSRRIRNKTVAKLSSAQKEHAKRLLDEG